jgi:hypothetical protein
MTPTIQPAQPWCLPQGGTVAPCGNGNTDNCPRHHTARAHPIHHRASRWGRVWTWAQRESQHVSFLCTLGSQKLDQATGGKGKTLCGDCDPPQEDPGKQSKCPSGGRIKVRSPASTLRSILGVWVRATHAMGKTPRGTVTKGQREALPCAAAAKQGLRPLIL